jgi:hypothetical protein
MNAVICERAIVSGSGKKIGLRCLVAVDSSTSLVGIAIIFRDSASSPSSSHSL